MNHQLLSKFQRKMFWLALGLAVALHITAAAFLIFLGGAPAKGQYRELAVMDFAYYDPDGGEPGGGDSVAPMPPEETAPAEKAVAPEAEPEPEDPPDVITSKAEEASPSPAPPPPVKEKVKPKAKPKPKPQAKQVQAAGKASAEAAAGAKPGGGPGSGQGGVGGGTGQGNPKIFSAYTSKIRAKLNRLKKYPSAAASQRLGGIVTVNFTIDRSGHVTASHLVKSSGHPVLDQEAMALLKRCSPFPAMPKEMPQTTLNLTVPIQFNPPR